MNQAVSAFAAARPTAPGYAPDIAAAARPAIDVDRILARLDRLGELLGDQVGNQVGRDEVVALSTRIDGMGVDVTAACQLLDAVAQDVSMLSDGLRTCEGVALAMTTRIEALELRLAESLAEGEQMALELESRLALLEARDHGPVAGDDALEAALGECSARLGQALALAEGAGTGDNRVEEALWALSEQIAAFESRLVGQLETPGPSEPSADRVATPGWQAPGSAEDQIRLLLTGALNVPASPDPDGA